MRIILRLEVKDQLRPETDVSEQEQSGEMQPQQNPQVQQTTEVIVDDTGIQPTYANFCRITATPEEMILDFGLNTQPFATGRQEVKASQRIVMNAYTTKRLLTAIGMTLQRHEQTFGVIELDVQRRVSTPRPQLAPAEVRAPGDQPQVIRLDH
jgi:uncharacterized protein DUF3467